MTSSQSSVASCDQCAVALPAQGVPPTERQVEAAGWHEIHSLVDDLTEQEALTPGYFDEGWTVRDMLGHIGAWLAEAGQLMEQMRTRTYREGELDVDEANARFFELMRDVPLATVKLQAWAARSRMLAAWSQLSEPGPEARAWIAKAGPDHYNEHLPRLREWTSQLRGRRQAGPTRTA